MGQPTSGEGEGKGEGSSSKPASFSLGLPSFLFPSRPFPPTLLLVQYPELHAFPGHQALAQAKPRGLSPLLSLPSPVSLSACGGFGCDIVQVPRQEPLGLAASLLLTEEVVEGVAGFA